MKTLDLTECHEESPDFRESLLHRENALDDLDKKLKRICAICLEREKLAEKDRELMRELSDQFQSPLPDLVDSIDEGIQNSMQVMNATFQLLIDNHERLFEQINQGIVKPIESFLTSQLDPVKSKGRDYHKAHAEAIAITEKFAQCKNTEMSQWTELSFQLLDARYHVHKTLCAYVLDLNRLHSKKLPDFLQTLTDFMTSQLSYFHISHVTVKDMEPHLATMFKTLEILQHNVASQDTKQRTICQGLLEQVMIGRIHDLVTFQTQDLHIPMETAQANVRQHVAQKYPNVNVGTVTSLERPISPVLTKSGYLFYAEQRTFGIAWIRLYFVIKDDALVCTEPLKVKQPIFLHLNLCNVKPSATSDTERNFSFKVTSPTRVILLQADSTQEMQSWIQVMYNAIGHALNVASPEQSFARPDSPNGEQLPIPPSRSRKRQAILKELASIEGNTMCVDCGCGDPKWASVNLGVLMCIECSGTHRGLGVRSLTLDALKPEWVQRIRDVGNKASNQVYEALLPSDFDKGTMCRNDGRAQFIKDKYTAMKYTAELDKERILAERSESRAESMRKSSVQLTSAPDITEQTDDDASLIGSGSGSISPSSKEESNNVMGKRTKPSAAGKETKHTK
ncbi:hypothetical protein EMCRGX_G021243 [Ephydatia muelleri]